MLVCVESLMGAAEIGELLGVSRQRVQQLVTRSDFPAPAVELAMGKVWRREDIERWAADRGRRLAGE
jgi:predicted DNA-binding transcriptional regulator AlpA